MSTLNNTRFSILHGEDDPNDILFFQRALESMDYQGQYNTLSIGQDIVDWVLKQGNYAYASHRLPSVIFLDIGLPGLNGKQILQCLRADDSTKHIPIVIMSGSVSERDFHECISLGCNGYIQKNESLSFFTETCQLLVKSFMNLSCQNFV